MHKLEEWHKLNAHVRECTEMDRLANVFGAHSPAVYYTDYTWSR
jgi:hypothetical protein